MAGKRKTPAKKQAELVFEDGQWFLVQGNKKLDVGRSRRYAEKMLAEANA